MAGNSGTSGENSGKTASRGRAFPKGVSGNPNGRPKKRTDSDRITADDWFSVLTGLGITGHDKRTGTAGEWGFIADCVSFQQAQELWIGDDIAARIIETKPKEMLRQGFELRIDDDAAEAKALEEESEKTKEEIPPKEEDTYPNAQARGDVKGYIKRKRIRMDAARRTKELAELVEAKWKELNLSEALYTALCYERAYGGAAIMLGANDYATDLSKPLKVESVSEFTFLTVYEPRECQPLYYYADPRAPKYGEPAIYQVTLSSAGSPPPGQKNLPLTEVMLVHESRLLVFPGIKVSRYQPATGTYGGWGVSILTRVMRVLRDFNAAFGAAGILTVDFAQAIFKMKGLHELFSQDKGDVVKNRMKAVELSRSVARAVLIDAEEEFERKQTPVEGLVDLLDKFIERLCAAAEHPRTLLFGSSPGGLNATGESDIRQWYDRCKSEQEQKLLGHITRVVELILQTMGEKPASWSICFHPLWQPTDKERAETRKIVMETDVGYVNASVLAAEEVAISRFGGEEWSMETVVDFDARAKGEPAAEGPAKTQAQIEAEEAEQEMAMKTLEAKTKAPLAAGGGNAPPFGKKSEEGAVPPKKKEEEKPA